MNTIIRGLKIYWNERLRLDMLLLRSRIALFVFNCIPDFYSLSPLRNLILNIGGARTSIFYSYIRSPFWCTQLSGLQFGKGVFINMGCRFEGTAPIVIGDQCQIGPFCCFENVNHVGTEDLKCPISIGSQVWIGAKVVITPGVCIGDRVIVAAGAVVTKNIPDRELWGGVPAKKIRDTLQSSAE